MKQELEIKSDYETYAQFAARANISKRFLQELCSQGVIPTVKLGRRCVRIPVERALGVIRDLEVQG
jgi:excisionase family DNA binding protein